MPPALPTFAYLYVAHQTLKGALETPDSPLWGHCSGVGMSKLGPGSAYEPNDTYWFPRGIRTLDRPYDQMVVM